MPALPAHYNVQTLTQYFDMIDEMDPKGGALAQQVSNFSDRLAANTLAS